MGAEVEQVLVELVAGFNTVSAEQREYKLVLDDVISTTNAKYVSRATPGFFPNQTQPAYRCVRACVLLNRAAQLFRSNKKQAVEMLAKAQEDVTQADWDGTSKSGDPRVPNKLKSDFLALRQDKDARKDSEYNELLAHLYNASGSAFESIRGQGLEHVENCYTAIAQLAMACSLPNLPPFGFAQEELDQGLHAAKRMIEYAVTVSKSL